MNCVAIYPNNDTGGDIIVNAMDRFRGNRSVRIIPSMRFEYFLTLLKHARAIVGNSSAGIREAPVYGVPTVNIGTRQLNRFEHSSIINVAEDAAAVTGALHNLPNAVVPSRYFGGGESARHFREELSRPQIWKTSRQKHFRDLRHVSPLAQPAMM